MNIIHIENSYNTWCPSTMYRTINANCVKQHHTLSANKILNRSYNSMYLEWWLHNIKYYLTIPFVKNYDINIINQRLKHIDLKEKVINK